MARQPELIAIGEDFDDALRGRRSPKGSREPVTFSPAQNKPTTVSSLSASDTAAHVVAAARAARGSAARRLRHPTGR